MTDMYVPGQVVVIKGKRQVIKEKYSTKDLEQKRSVVTMSGKVSPVDVTTTDVQYEKNQVVMVGRTSGLITENYETPSTRLKVRVADGSTRTVDSREVSDFPTIPWFRKGQLAVIVVGGGAIPKGTQVTVQSDGGAPGRNDHVRVKHSKSTETFSVSRGHMLPL